MEAFGANWSVFGNRHYIKYLFYNMKWDIVDDFKDYHVACEPYGGSIAIVSKSKSNQELRIYSASGVVISKKPWQDASIIGIHWADSDQLMAVQSSGNVCICGIQGGDGKYVHMGDAVKSHGVKSFRFFPTVQGTGLMVLTQLNDIYYKLNILNIDSIIRCIRNVGQTITDTIGDWVAFTDVCGNREPTALLACGSVLIRMQEDKEPQVFADWCSSNGRIVAVTVSPSQQHVAVVTTDGHVFLMQADLRLRLFKYQFDMGVKYGDPVEGRWAGEDMYIVLAFNNLFVMGIDGDMTETMYLDDPVLFSEIDGVRFITATKHEFIQPINNQLEQLYQYQQDSPAAVLHEAQDSLERGSFDAVRSLELILSEQGAMLRAIDVCLTAASHCIEPDGQKRILRALWLGRSYFPTYRADDVADVHRRLTLINNLKLPFVAMPVTMAELNQMTMPVLINRLINRGYYPFVERICKRLRVADKDGVHLMLEQWAERTMESPDYNGRIENVIVDRLEKHKGFNYGRLASVACKFNKVSLAEKLLNKEPRIEEQVKVLMQLNRNSDALNRAVESGNVDLILYIVSSLKKNLKNVEFLTIIQKNSVAKAVYIENIIGDVDLKRSFEIVEGDPPAKPEDKLKDALKAESLQSSFSCMSAAYDAYKKCGNDFMLQVLDDEKVLLQQMMVTFKDGGVDGYGVTMPMYEYLSYLFDHRLDDRAESMKQKLKVPDRQFYWLKLKSFGKLDRWDEFEKLIQKWSRKMPVTFYDIAEICVNNSNEEQFNKYVDKVEPEKRVRLYVQMDKFQEAEELARSIKNEYLITYVSTFKH